jgi:hypothetical protein
MASLYRLMSCVCFGLAVLWGVMGLNAPTVKVWFFIATLIVLGVLLFEKSFHEHS